MLCQNVLQIAVALRSKKHPYLFKGAENQGEVIRIHLYELESRMSNFMQ